MTMSWYRMCQCIEPDYFRLFTFESTFLCPNFEVNWFEDAYFKFAWNVCMRVWVCDIPRIVYCAKCWRWTTEMKNGDKNDPSSNIKCHQIKTWRVLCLTAFVCVSKLKGFVENVLCDLLNHITYDSLKCGSKLAESGFDSFGLSPLLPLNKRERSLKIFIDWTENVSNSMVITIMS